MRIIRKGKLQNKNYWYQGECRNCKAIVEYTQEEAFKLDHVNTSCPTEGCTSKIHIFIENRRWHWFWDGIANKF